MLTQTHKLLLFSNLLISNASAKCPFGFGADDDEAKPEDKALPQLNDVVISTGEKQEVRKLQAQEFNYPYDLFTCTEGENKTKVMKTQEFTTQDYMDIAESVNQKYDEAEDKNSFAGCLVRLAGHDMMDFRYSFGTNKDGTPNKSAIEQRGGVDGCVNFNDKDNMGLVDCILETNIIEAYDENCGAVSLADFIVIAAEATMARTSNSYNPDALDSYADGTLAKVFRDQFQFGRATAESCDWNEGLMPDPEKGCNDINDIFGKHLFKYKMRRDHRRLSAAILGAHTLGSAKIENSGYSGDWSTTNGVFDNDYYRQMITRGWGPDRAVDGNEERNQWKTVDHGPTDGLMLNTDLCLAYDNNAEHQACMEANNFNNRRCKKFQNKGKPINALETQCCAWTHKGALFNNKVFDKSVGTGNICGKDIPFRGKGSNFQNVKDACCVNQHSDSTGDCDSSQWPKGQSFRDVLTFAAHEDKWLASYAEAWKILTENGHIDLSQLVKEEDTEEEAECGKLRTKKLCENQDHGAMCAWQPKPNGEKTKKGRPKMHCDLLSKAPPKPEKVKKSRNKMKNNKNKNKNKMNRNKSKKQNAGSP